MSIRVNSEASIKRAARVLERKKTTCIDGGTTGATDQHSKFLGVRAAVERQPLAATGLSSVLAAAVGLVHLDITVPPAIPQSPDAADTVEPRSASLVVIAEPLRDYLGSGPPCVQQEVAYHGEYCLWRLDLSPTPEPEETKNRRPDSMGSSRGRAAASTTYNPSQCSERKPSGLRRFLSASSLCHRLAKGPVLDVSANRGVDRIGDWESLQGVGKCVVFRDLVS